MVDALSSSSKSTSAEPPSPAEQLRQANHRLSVVNQELDVANEQLRVANEQLLVANNQLRVYNEEIRTQAAELQQSEAAVHRLNDELSLINVGLLDTIDDSLQATECARAEAEAQRLRLHRLVAEASAMIAVLTGPNHMVELANDYFRAMFGHRELVGQPFRQAAIELADQPFFDQLDQVYRTGETYTGTDMPVTLDRAHSGQFEHLFATYIFQATRDGAGAIDGLLIFAYDVTNQVRARQVLEANYQHLTYTNEELDTFVYTASHDLQGPLNNIYGLLEALRRALPAAGQPALVTRILGLLHDSAGRFQRTLTQLGTIARVQAEAGLPALSVALADVVQGVLHDLALPIAEADAQITVDVAECPRVSFAEKNLRSVVYNLVSNAVKYRHPDRVPQVRVQGRAEADFWVLEVQDNGLGLALPASGSTFNLFQRFRTHVDGSGVGLYLVQQLMERAGGRLEVSSQLGQGATFTVYFKR